MWGTVTLYPWLSLRMCHFSAKDTDWRKKGKKKNLKGTALCSSCMLLSPPNSCLAFLIHPPFSVLWRTGWFVSIQTLTEWLLLWDWHQLDAANTANRYYGGPEKQYARKKKKTKDRKAEGEGTCAWATVHVRVCLKENRRCKSEGVFLFKNDRDASLSVAE